MLARPLSFPARDGYRLAGDLFSPDDRPDAAVLVAPAMGVARRYYGAFASYLARRGLAALTFDVRGVGGSRPHTLRGFEATLHGWAEQDVAGALDALAAAVPGRPLLYVGHSAGGQLFGLLEQAPVEGVLLVGAQSGHWRHWPVPTRLLMAGLWWVLVPAMVGAFGRLPMALLRQGEDVPAGVAREWAAWGRDRDYLRPYARSRGGRAFARYRGPLRSYAIEDDGYAPPRSVEALAAFYESARVEVRRVRPADVGERRIGHFGFFRPRLEGTLWAEAADWLAAVARRERAA